MESWDIYWCLVRLGNDLFLIIVKIFAGQADHYDLNLSTRFGLCGKGCDIVSRRLQVALELNHSIHFKENLFQYRFYLIIMNI